MIKMADTYVLGVMNEGIKDKDKKSNCVGSKRGFNLKKEVSQNWFYYGVAAVAATLTVFGLGVKYGRLNQTQTITFNLNPLKWW